MAEIAAGTRKHLSASTLSNANSSDYRERAQHEAKEAERANMQVKQLQAIQDAARMQSANQARSFEIQREIAAVAHEQLAFERQAHDEAMRAAADAVRAAEEAEDAAQDRYERAQEAERIRTSPTYSTALMLLEKANLERLLREQHNIEELLAPAEGVLQSVKTAMAVVDAETAESVRIANEADARVLAGRQIQIDIQNEILAKLGRALAFNNSELQKYRRTFNQSTWNGPYAEQRQQLLAARSELISEIAAKKHEIEKLAQASITKDQRARLLEERKKKLMGICLQTGANDLITKVHQTINAWNEQRNCSHQFVDALTSWGLSEDMLYSDDVDVEYSLCVTLDHARASGATTISYPGIGVVPIGTELVNTIHTLKQLRQRVPPFATGDSDYGRNAEPPGLQEFKELIAVVNDGTISDSHELDGIGVNSGSFHEKDKLDWDSNEKSSHGKSQQSIFETDSNWIDMYSIYEELVKDLSLDKKSSFYAAPDLPAAKINNFTTNSKYHVDKSILMFYYDDTVFGKGDVGVAVDFDNVVVKLPFFETNIIPLHTISSIEAKLGYNKKIIFNLKNGSKETIGLTQKGVDMLYHALVQLVALRESQS